MTDTITGSGGDLALVLGLQLQVIKVRAVAGQHHAPAGVEHGEVGAPELHPGAGPAVDRREIEEPTEPAAPARLVR